MNQHEEIRIMGEKAVKASRRLVSLGSKKKNSILLAMGEELDSRRQELKKANDLDMEAGKQAGLSDALLDRLLLSDARIDSMIKGLREIAELKDPINKLIRKSTRPNNLRIKKVRVPIGVIAIIYESRPNVTADAAALCFKASNAVILRGGKEAVHSNRAIADALQAGGRKKGLPPDSVQLVKIPGHEAIRDLVQLVGLVDLVIPRGGEKLINMVTENAHVPVIKHYKGICHTYIDEHADPAMAVSIAENAKCQRPGVCNAMETLLVHSKIADGVLPDICRVLEARGVELRGDEAVRAICPRVRPASENDWDTEYLDMILSIKVVPNARTAIEHINVHGSHHSDAIVTESNRVARLFTKQVDSSSVYVNASTRFTDGGEFGMGAEIGISTDKLHARGPMGLEELCTYKYIVEGTGQIRE